MSTLLANDIERRILGHLPVWRGPERQAAAEQDEKEAGFRSVTAYSTDDMVNRLSSDQVMAGEVRAQENPAEWVAAQLESLARKGLCEQDAGTGWKMTPEGAQALAQPNDGLPSPPAHDVERIKGMVEFSTKLLAAGMEPGSDEFNKAGGITRQGVTAWRAQLPEDFASEPGELDAIEAQAPLAPEPSDLQEAQPSA